MQLLSCHIAIAGDDNSIVVRDIDNPVTYPEMLVLKVLHGAEHVRHVEAIGEIERDSDEERSRLNELYGVSVVSQTFPGITSLPEHDPKVRTRKAKPAPAPEPEGDVFEGAKEASSDPHVDLPAVTKRR